MTSDREKDLWPELVLSAEVRSRLQKLWASIPGSPTVKTLISGPPGTGKTEITKAFGQIPGVSFTRVVAMDFIGPGLGENARRVNEIFSKVRHLAPAILCIDLEQGPYSDYCLFPKRESPGFDSRALELEMETLAQLDGFRNLPVWIFAETFHAEEIDPAVLRRFDLTIEIPLPTETERSEILKRNILKFAGRTEFNIEAIAARLAALSTGSSGRDLEILVRSACSSAVERALNAGTPETIVMRSDDLTHQLKSKLGPIVKTEIEVRMGDITHQAVDAIVNAANASLLGGGGVDGAIRRAAGQKLVEECRTLGGCETGEAKLTKGYNLPARFVIHTVGPVYRGGASGEPELLANCYRNSIRIARQHQFKTIAFPSVSTGLFGYPIADASRIAMRAVKDELEAEDSTLERVIFITFGSTDCREYQKAYQEVWS